jgi:hypothetical protein
MGPFSFPDARDLLEVLVGLPGGSPTETLSPVEDLNISKSNTTNFMIKWKNETRA